MLKHKKTLIISTLILLLPMLVGLILWNKLPDDIPTHWNAEGVIDGWSSKPFAVFGLPGFLLAVHWICVLATQADPKHKNQSGKMQQLVLWICPVISLLLMVLVFGTPLGLEIRVEVVTPLLMGIMFIVLGNYMPKCKQNYTMGIKLPWTLNSEENWNATHRLAGFLWVLGGILIIVSSLLLPSTLAWVLLPMLIVLVLVPMVYSYIYHRRHG